MHLNIQTRVSRLYNITLDEAYKLLVIVRDAVKGVFWVKNWWGARSAFDKWTIRVALAHTVIAGLPAIIVGVLAALVLTNGSVPPAMSPYYLYYQTTFMIIALFVCLFGYLGIRTFVLDRFKELLRLEMPRGVVDDIISRRIK